MFTQKDRREASRAHELYMFHIHNFGLRWEFDAHPGREFTQPHSLGQGLKKLPRWVGEFDEFIRILERFKDRPISVMRKGREVACSIGEAELRTYTCMYEAFSKYEEAARKKGVNSPEAHRAALEAAYVVNPEAWRKAGAPVPEGVKPYMELRTRHYLEFVMNDES